MKISTMMQRTVLDTEDRKRALQRREVGEAYKRSAKFVEASKNPLLAALESLLSGQTEKELLAADKVGEKQFTQQQKLEHPEVKKEVEQLKRTEEEVIQHEQAHKAAESGEVPIQLKESATHEETIKILEIVQQAALAPAEPSPQDLRVAASAATQIQQTRVEMLKEQGIEVEEAADVEPFADESFKVDIPERFLQTPKRNPEEPTIFGQDLEQRMFQRAFSRATNQYASHIAMVKNGYKPYMEPSFSKIA